LIAENVRGGSVCVPVRKWFGFCFVGGLWIRTHSRSDPVWIRFCVVFCGFVLAYNFEFYLKSGSGSGPGSGFGSGSGFDSILIQRRIWMPVGPDPQPGNGETKPFSCRWVFFIYIYTCCIRNQCRTAVNWAKSEKVE
jgi:hypothetical protein